jgi:hypothetical protein
VTASQLRASADMSYHRCKFEAVFVRDAIECVTTEVGVAAAIGAALLPLNCGRLSRCAGASRMPSCVRAGA